jgi:hypothetical protein
MHVKNAVITSSVLKSDCFLSFGEQKYERLCADRNDSSRVKCIDRIDLFVSVKADACSDACALICKSFSRLDMFEVRTMYIFAIVHERVFTV